MTATATTGAAAARGKLGSVRIGVMEPESSQVEFLAYGLEERNKWEAAGPSGNPVLLQRDGHLVTPSGDGRELVPATPDSLAALARWSVVPYKYAKDSKGNVKRGRDGEPVEVDLPSLPRPLVKAYMDARRWPGVPEVRGVAAAPLVRPDFTVRWEPGWDARSGYWVAPGVERDTRLLDAGFDVRDVFGQFPFAHPGHVADALAMALTPLLMTALPAAPVPTFLVTAREQGSGKTYLAQFAGAMGAAGAGDGLLPSVSMWRQGNAGDLAVESAVLSNERLVIFDNVKGDIDSKVLEAAVTSRSLSIRRFHSQQVVKARSLTSWVLTANGAAASADMARRSVVILLDKGAFPRGWDGTWVRWVQQHEAALVTATVALVEEWAAAGCPTGHATLSNFERWAEVVSGILEENGVGGFLDGREEALATAVTTDTDDQAEVVNRIRALMGEDPWTAGDLWNRANDMSVGGAFDTDRTFVRSWLEECSKGKKDGTKAVGWALSKLVGRPFDGSDWVIRKRSRDYVVTRAGARAGAVST